MLWKACSILYMYYFYKHNSTRSHLHQCPGKSQKVLSQNIGSCYRGDHVLFPSAELIVELH